LYNRNLKRLAGLCELNKADEYTFPWEMSDFYEMSKETFSLDDSALETSYHARKENLIDYIFNFLRKIKKLLKLIKKIFISS
jgi:hypothetical protein